MELADALTSQDEGTSVSITVDTCNGMHQFCRSCQARLPEPDPSKRLVKCIKCNFFHPVQDPPLGQRWISCSCGNVVLAALSSARPVCSNCSAVHETPLTPFPCRHCNKMVSMVPQVSAVKCQHCGEATPTGKAPEGTKYCYCPRCPALVIARLKSKRVLCPRKDCRAVIKPGKDHERGNVKKIVKKAFWSKIAHPADALSSLWQYVSGTTWLKTFFFLFMWPFVLEFFVFFPVLGLVLPFAFILQKFRVHMTFLYILLTTCIFVGATVDLSADVACLANSAAGIFENRTLSVAEESMSTIEENLAISRLFFTMIGAFPGIIILFCTRLLLTETAEIKFCKCFPNSKILIALSYLFLACFWKLALFGVRVFLFALLFYSLLRNYYHYGKLGIGKAATNLLHYTEVLMFMDLFVSGIPLGVLTSLELFLFKYEHLYEFKVETIWSFIKLGALLLNLIGASHLLFNVLIWKYSDEEKKAPVKQKNKKRRRESAYLINSNPKITKAKDRVLVNEDIEEGTDASEF
eukprot:TRINITY_DN9860_c0_g1_i1.p1 TRINITY_DN9860_c0_g1~~TRINITY_DN9860_c0_g1_i1.p1  ORF type:complete len:522 (-),score=60.85 TRINITY_DN9860_c0_g1_i1:64-1629(-)